MFFFDKLVYFISKVRTIQLLNLDVVKITQ
nr:MAG TPA: hypothetical protein [Caudoviricetes sp.]